MCSKFIVEIANQILQHAILKLLKAQLAEQNVLLLVFFSFRSEMQVVIYWRQEQNKT